MGRQRVSLVLTFTSPPHPPSLSSPLGPSSFLFTHKADSSLLLSFPLLIPSGLPSLTPSSTAATTPSAASNVMDPFDPFVLLPLPSTAPSAFISLFWAHQILYDFFSQ